MFLRFARLSSSVFVRTQLKSLQTMEYSNVMKEENVYNRDDEVSETSSSFIHLAPQQVPRQNQLLPSTNSQNNYVSSKKWRKPSFFFTNQSHQTQTIEQKSNRRGDIIIGDGIVYEESLITNNCLLCKRIQDHRKFKSNFNTRLKPVNDFEESAEDFDTVASLILPFLSSNSTFNEKFLDDLCDLCLDRFTKLIEKDIKSLNHETECYMEKVDEEENKYNSKINGENDFSSQYDQEEITQASELCQRLSLEANQLSQLHEKQVKRSQWLYQEEDKTLMKLNSLEFHSFKVQDRIRDLTFKCSQTSKEINCLKSDVSLLNTLLFDFGLYYQEKKHSTINGLRLSHGPILLQTIERIVDYDEVCDDDNIIIYDQDFDELDWQEINAAWSQAAQILLFAAGLSKYAFKDLRIVPSSTCAKIIQLVKPASQDRKQGRNNRIEYLLGAEIINGINTDRNFIQNKQKVKFSMKKRGIHHQQYAHSRKVKKFYHNLESASLMKSLRVFNRLLHQIIDHVIKTNGVRNNSTKHPQIDNSGKETNKSNIEKSSSTKDGISSGNMYYVASQPPYEIKPTKIGNVDFSTIVDTGEDDQAWARAVTYIAADLHWLSKTLGLQRC